jgi:hypothetical protein
MDTNVGRSTVRRKLGALLAAGLAAASVACNDSSSPAAARDVSLSFATRAGAAAGIGQTSSEGAPDVNGAFTVRDATHTLTITRAAVVLSELELATTTTPCDSDDDAGDDHGDHSGNDHADYRHGDHCAELELGPLLVDLPVDSSVTTVLTLAVPAGKYTQLEAKLRPVHDDDASAREFRAAHPELAGASVRVEGTFDGVPFVYTGAPRAHLELEFDPPLEVNADGTNITVNVALDSWFTGADGALIDPATAAPGGSNAAVVADNILRAFHAFRDDDRRGHDGPGDDHGHDDGSDDHRG